MLMDSDGYSYMSPPSHKAPNTLHDATIFPANLLRQQYVALYCIQVRVEALASICIGCTRCSSSEFWNGLMLMHAHLWSNFISGYHSPQITERDTEEKRYYWIRPLTSEWTPRAKISDWIGPYQKFHPAHDCDFNVPDWLNLWDTPTICWDLHAL